MLHALTKGFREFFLILPISCSFLKVLFSIKTLSGLQFKKNGSRTNTRFESHHRDSAWRVTLLALLIGSESSLSSHWLRNWKRVNEIISPKGTRAPPVASLMWEVWIGSLRDGGSDFSNLQCENTSFRALQTKLNKGETEIRKLWDKKLIGNSS